MAKKREYEDESYGDDFAWASGTRCLTEKSGSEFRTRICEMRMSGTGRLFLFNKMRKWTQRPVLNVLQQIEEAISSNYIK